LEAKTRLAHTSVGTPHLSCFYNRPILQTLKKGNRRIDKVSYEVEGGGGKKSDGSKETEVELSPVEWQVFVGMKTVEVQTIGKQLGQDAAFIKAKIRSALARIDEKLKITGLS
jgi:hypothetical protein